MSTKPLDRSQFPALAKFYRDHLTNNIMGFWDKFSPDAKHGGYFHCFDREGNITDRRKNIWCQGRMTYMYSALYRRLEMKQTWLDNATLGRDFLVKHAYKGKGRWHYMLDETGKPINSSPSYYADSFCLQGLCEYQLATGDKRDQAIIEETYESISKNIFDPSHSEFHHFTPEKGVLYQGPSMVFVGCAPMLRAVLGAPRVDAIVKTCLTRLVTTFYKGNGLFYEVLGVDGNELPDGKSLTTNPGHTIECAWFCMEEALYQKDQTLLARAIDMAAAAYDKGYDKQLGGMFGFVDIHGNRPAGPEVMNAFGERWDHKIWWVHSEGLNALILAAIAGNRQDMMDRFLAMHDFTFKYFPDPKFGEWYEYLERDGKPWYTDKAKWIKSAYHIPRNLLNITLLLEGKK